MWPSCRATHATCRGTSSMSKPCQVGSEKLSGTNPNIYSVSPTCGAPREQVRTGLIQQDGIAMCQCPVARSSPISSRFLILIASLFSVMGRSYDTIPSLTDCGACFIVSACRAPTDWGRFFANRPHRKSLKFRSCLRTGRRTCILVGGLIKRSALYEETALAADSAGRAGGWMLVVVGDMAADVRRAGRLQSGVYLRRARYYSLASCRSSPSVRLAGLGEPTGIQ